MAPTAQSKAEQIAEATARGGQGDTPVEGAGANLDLPSEATGPADDVVTPRAPPSGERDVQPARPPGNSKRDAIVARYRTEVRPASDAGEDAEDIRRFTREGLPPEMVDPETPVETPVEPEPVATEPPATPQRRRIKVRGQEIELSDAELEAAAQRGLAGDSYFEEGRRTADEAKAALQRANELIALANTQGVRQPAPANTPRAEAAETPDPAASEHPAGPTTADVVKAIAFDDPEKAAELLEGYVEARVKRAAVPAVTQTMTADRERDELTRSQTAVNAAMTAHKDIAGDEMAISAVKTNIAKLQLEDLRQLGIAEDKLPNTHDQIGKWHLFYRAKGMQVRSMDKLLDDGITGYRTWRGGAETPTADPVPPAPQPKRTEVEVDRTQRLARVPQQPTRAVVPRQLQQPQPDPLAKRTTVVQGMIDRRKAARMGRAAG